MHWPARKCLLALCAGSLLAAGCAPVGPNYQRAPVETPPAYKEQPPAGWKTATPSDEISKGNWWEIFGDPELNALETQAIATNQNLRAAADRVLEARAAATATRSNLFPFVGATPSISEARSSGTRPAPPGTPLAAYSASAFSLPVQASYEVDLWGQIRRSLESANALAQMSEADYENVLLTLKSDVASYYIMVHFIDQERTILTNNLAAQQQALNLAEVRHNGGVASGLDVSEAETLLDTTQADFVGLGVQRAEFEHALSVLLGLPPAEFSLPPKPLDIVPPAVPEGLPSDLLERRPDVAAAERRMAALNAQVGIARAAYFPSLALTGAGGYLSSSLVQLFNLPSLVWSVAASVSQPLYEGGRLSADLAQARAAYDESVANYRQQVLTAFSEVENGLSGLRVLEDQARAYDQAVRAAQQTVDISTSRYREGLANYLEVITAETNLLNNQLVADQIQEQRLLTTVELIQALGGGWQESRIYASGSGGPAANAPNAPAGAPSVPAPETKQPAQP